MSKKSDMAELRSWFIKEGYGRKETGIMIRFLLNNPTKKEKKQWIKVGVMDKKGMISIDNPEEGISSIEIHLFSLCYKGIIKRSETK